MKIIQRDEKGNITKVFCDVHHPEACECPTSVTIDPTPEIQEVYDGLKKTVTNAASAELTLTKISEALRKARPARCKKCSLPTEGHERDGSQLCWCKV